MNNLVVGLLLLAVFAFTPVVVGVFLMRRGKSAVWVVLGLAWAALCLATALPSFRPARSTAQKNSCIAYLKQIDGAKAQWASEKKPEAAVVPQLSDLVPYLKGGLLPVCPANGTYTLGAVNELPRCSHADKGHALTPPR